MTGGAEHQAHARYEPGPAAGPAVTGAVAGSAVPLALVLGHVWQYAVLAAAGLWLLALRRGVVSALLAAGGVGLVAALAGLPVG
ncbi:hypothetical protein ABH931_007138 [Streptacidiphilus sp. MAP12-33]|uniref:hypothetical protein n=1 Tax=Streptacidiphilus sp. MAP12-33 TaxID=3156266 RepID=UPI0035163C64